MPSADVIPNTFLPYLIVREHTVLFNNIYETIKLFDGGPRPYYIVTLGEDHKSAYPILTGIMAVPIYAIPLILNKIPELTYHENLIKMLFLGRIAACFYATLSVLLFYLITKKVSTNEKRNLIFTFMYAFGTSTWSVSSRGLWQHTTSQLALSLLVYIGLLGLTNKKLLPWLGLVAGIAVLIRPTNIIFALLIALFVLHKHREQFVKFCVLATPTILALLLYNTVTFGGPISEGYGARNDFSWVTPLWESIPAYFISPGRGYLFISPFLLVGFYTLIKVFVSKNYLSKKNTYYRYLGLGVILTLLLFGKWYTWHGSPAFGNRMLADILPIVGLFSYEVIAVIRKQFFYLVILLGLYSTYVHFNATYFRKGRCSADHNWSFYCLKLPAGPTEY